jgi:hypothetical protein
LYKLTDTTGSTGTLSGTAATIATPPGNAGFRGVALAPELPPQPIPPHAPTCAGTSASTAYETPVALTIECSDADGDPVVRRVVDGPARGTLGAFDNATGAVVYRPKRGATGRDVFTIAAGDGNFESEPATVTVDIGPAPPAPRAEPPATLPMGLSITAFKRSSRALTFKVACTPGGALDACRGRLRIELPKPIGSLRRLGGLAFDIPTGRTRTLRLSLHRSVRRRLAGRSVQVRVAGWVRQAAPRPTAVSPATTTLKPPAK